MNIDSSNNLAHPRPSRAPSWPLVVNLLLAGWIAFCALKIEQLNAAARSYLPNDASKRQSVIYGGSGAWRAVRVDESLWRETEFGTATDAQTRLLTPDQQTKMNEEIDQSLINYELRRWANGFGMLQYLLIVVVALITVHASRFPVVDWQGKLIHSVPVVISIAAGLLAVYRGYIRSGVD